MKHIMVIALILALVVACGCGHPICRKTAEVVACDNGLVTVKDANGNLWQYYDTENQPDGTILTLVMNGDEIVDVKY